MDIGFGHLRGETKFVLESFAGGYGEKAMQPRYFEKLLHGRIEIVEYQADAFRHGFVEKFHECADGG
jgi:hypothetical protein